MKKDKSIAPAVAEETEQVKNSRREAGLAMRCVIDIAILNGITTYQALADASGMDRPQVSRYASNLIIPSLANFLRLCEAAGVSISISNLLKKGGVVVKI